LELEEIIYKHALANAVKHEGRAQVGPVVSKVLAERPDLKAKVKEVVEMAKKVVERVNSMPLEDQMREIQRYPEVLEEKKEEKKKILPPLPNVKGTVTTRFAPNPDGPIHLGNARAAVLSHEYAKMYGGKFILRFDDTDPKVKKPLLEAYQWIREDLKWLGINWDMEFSASSRMERYYEIAKVLLEKGYAYVDLGTEDGFRSWREKRINQSYPHRERPPEENLNLWEKMLQGEFNEGEAVVRIKTDPKSPDPSQVDWVMLRIIDTMKNPHPITGDKYRVWPTYNFATVVDDHDFNVSHILRAKEHMSNSLKQRWIYSYMGWEVPTILEFGRLKLEGFMMSKSKIRGLMETGSGRDDPRLPTLAGLRRRGILPETVRSLMIEVGLKVTDATISFDNLASMNRKLLDPSAKRLMFVRDKKSFKLLIPKDMEANIPLTPSKKEYRKIRVSPGDEIFLDPEDALEGRVLRLLELCNVRVEGDVLRFLDESLETAKRFNAPIVQWVKKSEAVPVTVLKAISNQELVTEDGFGEGYMSSLHEGEVVQLIRYGFCRVDRNDGKLLMVYAHD